MYIVYICIVEILGAWLTQITKIVSRMLDIVCIRGFTGAGLPSGGPAYVQLIRPQVSTLFLSLFHRYLRFFTLDASCVKTERERERERESQSEIKEEGENKKEKVGDRQ